MENTFTFYPKEFLEPLRTRNTASSFEELLKLAMLGPHPAAVVGIVGKSNCGKSELINSLLDLPVFETLEFEETDSTKSCWSCSSNTQCSIEFYHDVSTNTIYLNLASLGDHAIFSNICRSVSPDMTESELHIWLEKQEYHHLKALLFLFLCCNIILVVHNDHVFDISYLQLLRTLVPIKQLVYASVANYLGTLFDLAEMSSNFFPGRCCPSIAFIFNDRYLAHLKTDDKTTNLKSVRYNATTNARLKLQNALEAQVKLLLKSNSGKNEKHQAESPLYQLDQGHFVHVVTVNSDSDSLNALFPFFGQENDQYFSCSLFGEIDGKMDKKIRKADDGIDSLRLWIHNKSLNISKNPSALSSQTWFLASYALQDLFLFGRKVLGRTKGDQMEKIKAWLDADYKFSSSRCREVLSAAREVYFSDLPSQYNATYHQNKIDRMRMVFTSVALGPAQSHYWAMLVEECNKHWSDGRQSNESANAISLAPVPIVNNANSYRNSNDSTFGR